MTPQLSSLESKREIMKFLALVALLPLIEVAGFAVIGGKVGAMGVVFLTLCTAFLGVFLIKTQGFRTITQVKEQLAMGQAPAETVLSGTLVFVCGALLLIPGFFTDTLGLIGLLPAVRQSIAKAVLSRGVIVGSTTSSGTGRTRSQDSHVIEGEYRRED